MPNELPHIYSVQPTLQSDEELGWDVLKPEVFAVLMDFFATGLPAISDEPPAGDTGETEGTVEAR